MSSYPILSSRKLKIVIVKPTYKIGQVVASKWAKVTKEKTAVVKKVESEIIPNPPQITTELEVVVSASQRNRVLILKSGVMQFGWTLGRRPQIQIQGVDEHQGRGCSRWIVRIHIGEPKRLRRGSVLGHRLERCRAICREPELVYSSRRNRVRPCQ